MPPPAALAVRAVPSQAHRGLAPHPLPSVGAPSHPVLLMHTANSGSAASTIYCGCSSRSTTPSQLRRCNHCCQRTESVCCPHLLPSLMNPFALCTGFTFFAFATANTFFSFPVPHEMAWRPCPQIGNQPPCTGHIPCGHKPTSRPKKPPSFCARQRRPTPAAFLPWLVQRASHMSLDQLAQHALVMRSTTTTLGCQDHIGSPPRCSPTAAA